MVTFWTYAGESGTTLNDESKTQDKSSQNSIISMVHTVYSHRLTIIYTLYIYPNVLFSNAVRSDNELTVYPLIPRTDFNLMPNFYAKICIFSDINP